MGLDVYINTPREEHQQWEARRQKSLEEAKEMKGLIPLIEKYYADMEPDRTNELYWANITHNLTNMADAAGIYQPIWRPEEIGITKAGELIAQLEAGLMKMKGKPEYYKKFNPNNGWGNYTHFIDWIEKYLMACKEFPYGDISVSR